MPGQHYGCAVQGYLPPLSVPNTSCISSATCMAYIRPPAGAGQARARILGLGGGLRPQSRDSDEEFRAGRKPGGVRPAVRTGTACTFIIPSMERAGPLLAPTEVSYR